MKKLSKALAKFEVTSLKNVENLSSIKGGRLTGKVGGGTMGNGASYEDLEFDGPSGSTVVCNCKDGQS